MQFVERFVATVTYVLSFFSFARLQDLGTAPQVPIFATYIGVHDVAPAAPTGGPIFKPPTGRPNVTLPGGDLVCDYSRMGADWYNCSTAENRSCWLKNKKTGEVYDINSDYEDPKKVPKGVDRYYTLKVSDGWINADGQNFTEAKFFWNVSDPASYRPENRYPGPWVQACWGDTVHVNLINDLKFNGTTIHWHGIRQLNTTEMDGVPGVTQCPIAPKDNFTYSWTARQYGSSWYHSHFSLQYADGALGPLTIHGPTSDNWDEPKFPILMTDWGHNSAFQAIWTGVLVNQSTLLNGRGSVNRYNNSIHAQLPVPEPYSITVNSARVNGRAKRYLLRLINTSFESNFIFSIDNHLLTVVSTDFVAVQPYTRENVTVAIGQRINVILAADRIGSAAKSFWMRAYRPSCFNLNTGFNKSLPSVGYEKAGIVFYDDETKSPDWDPKHLPTGWNITTLPGGQCKDEPYENIHPVVPWHVGDPARVEKDLNVQVGPKGFEFPLSLFSIGGKDFNPFQIDYSSPMILHLGNTGKWNPSWVVYPEDIDPFYNSTSWVYLLLQGVPSAGTTFGAHPIHLHGHDFAILQQAYNISFPNGLNPKFDNPPRRDVVLLPQNGYVLMAFQTDNPGPWLMHCHIAQHASFGLGLQVLERRSTAHDTAVRTGAVKQAQQTCNKWNAWWGNCSNWWYDTDPKAKQGPGFWCDGGNDAFSPDSGI